MAINIEPKDLPYYSGGETGSIPTESFIDTITPNQLALTFPPKRTLFRGYYRQRRTAEQFITQEQVPRWVSMKIQNTGGFSNLFTRQNVENAFVCVGVLIQHALSSFPLQLRIADVVGSNASSRIVSYPAGSAGQIFMDLTSCPRVFLGTQFDLNTDQTLGGTEWVHVELFGWDEKP